MKGRRKLIKLGDLLIEKRKVLATKKRIKGKEYIQYVLTLPKEFAETHPEDIYIVANKIWIGAPDTETLLIILKHIPEIKSLLVERSE